MIEDARIIATIPFDLWKALAIVFAVWIVLAIGEGRRRG